MDEVKGDEQACERFKLLRVEMRSSQREFGEPLGFNQAAVSAFEQGKVALKKPDALAIEYVYGIRHEWLLFGRGPKVRDSGDLAEEEKEVLRIHRQMSHQDRPTWVKMGSLLAQQVWNGRSDRRASDRRQNDRRLSDRRQSDRRTEPPETSATEAGPHLRDAGRSDASEPVSPTAETENRRRR